MHLICFFVSRASFSFYSSSEITKIIYLILDYKKSKAFLTYSLSLFRMIWSLIICILYTVFFVNLSWSLLFTLFSNLFLTSLRLANISPCNIFNFSSNFEDWVYFNTSIIWEICLFFYYSFFYMKAILSSSASNLLQILRNYGFTALIFYSKSVLPAFFFFWRVYQSNIYLIYFSICSSLRSYLTKLSLILCRIGRVNCSCGLKLNDPPTWYSILEDYSRVFGLSPNEKSCV